MSHSSFILDHVGELQHAIVHRSVRQIVADKIVSMIGSGLLQVGDVLPSERNLASALSVSRETVRGGIQILVGQGVLSSVHGVGTSVLRDRLSDVSDVRGPINDYDLDHIHASRLLVEREVVTAACRNLQSKTLQVLNDSLKQQRSSLNDAVRFLVIDREFHLAIYRSCPNEVLADFVSDLYGYMVAFRRKALATENATRNSYEDHLHIVDALAAGDADRVGAAFGVHIDRIYSTTQRILAEVATDGGMEKGAVRPD